MKIQDVNEDFVWVTVQQAWDWSHKSFLVAQIDDRGDMVGMTTKEPLPGNMTCRLRVLLHCIAHPNDKIGLKALPETDRVELLKLREANKSKGKRKRRKK